MGSSASQHKSPRSRKATVVGCCISPNVGDSHERWASAQREDNNNTPENGPRAGVLGKEETSGATYDDLINERKSVRALKPRAAPSEDIGENVITSTQLYNVMNNGRGSPYIHLPRCMLILDTRPMESFVKCHIITAWHVSSLDLHSILLGPLDSYTIIILYGDDEDTDLKATDTFKKLFDENLDPMVLDGGFMAFQHDFPFLCTAQNIYSAKDRQNLLSYPSIVFENKLFLGSGDQAGNKIVMEHLGITHIVNITRERPNSFSDTITYHSIKVDDESSTKLIRYFPQIVEFIEEAIEDEGRVLVHCNLGVSRSSSAVLAYLMENKCWTLGDAYIFLKDRRPIIRPNHSFLRQLSQYEEKVFGSVYTDIDQMWV